MKRTTGRKLSIGRLIRGPAARRRAARDDREEQAFRALVDKFAKIQYLVEQRAMFDVIEKTPVGICITNPDYTYEYVNPAYCRIYGYSYDELVGKPFTTVVPEGNRAELMELHDRFMHQEYELEGEWDVVRKDGTRITILASAVYVVDEQFKPKKITFVIDRTEEIKAVRTIDRQRERLDEARALARELTAASDDAERASLGGRLISLLDSLSADSRSERRGTDGEGCE